MGTEPQYLGKYELRERLGFGGIAEGWKAFDIQLQCYVVVKILHADLQNNPNFMARFWSLPLDREVQVIASLHHPNIARIHGFQVSLPQASGNPLAYIVLDYREGQSLADYIRITSFKGEFIPAADLLGLFASLAAPIDYAHQQGIVHGNIKPSNILLDKRNTTHHPMGEPMLIDFGIIRLLGISAGALSHWEFDTPFYISPEQAAGQPGNKRSDIYALAAILYEMCTGVQPFRGENAHDVMIQQISTMPPAPKKINPAIIPAVSTLIMRNLAKDPAERFPSATAMTAALEKALDISDSETVRLPSYPRNTIKGTSAHSTAPSTFLTALGSSETSSASIFTARTSPQPSVPVSSSSITPSPASPAGLVSRSRRPRSKKSQIVLIVSILILLVALILVALFVLLHYAGNSLHIAAVQQVIHALLGLAIFGLAAYATPLIQQPLSSRETDAIVPAGSDSVLPTPGTGGPADGKPSAPPPPKGITRRQVLIGGGAALLVAGGLAIWRLVQNGLSSKRDISNQIITENALPGTSAWHITKGSTTQIQGYVSATSVDPGGLLTVYVSTQEAGTHYSISVYRLGWYGGLGASLKLTVNNLVGQAQGYWDNSTKTLVNCSTCYADPTTHLLEARFTASYTLKVPTNWITGVYLLMFTDAHGYQSYAHFVVRGNPSADYVVVRPNTTDQAYNNWGGHSLYSNTSIDNVAARKVSFDRPSTMQYGSDGVLVFEAPLIHWLERQGYDLSYLSDIDIHANSALLLQHKAYLSIGHDEYWTLEMRNGVEAARDAGVGLAFMGADTCDWQCRLEASGLGVSNRTVVCYKVAKGWHPGQPGYLPNDPLYGVNNSRVTTNWNDPVVNRPTAKLVGLYYSQFTSDPPGFPWTVDPSATSPYLEGTGLVPGQSYGCNLVGYEWDKIQAISPANIQVIGTSATIPNGGGSDTSNTITYVATSGALVFATGSIYWANALDSYRYKISHNCTDGVVPGMQKLFANIMLALVKNSRAIPNP